MSVRRRDREGAGVAPRSQRVSAFLAAHPLAVDRTLAAVTLLPVLLLSAFNPPRYWAEMLVPCLAGALALLGRRRAPGRSLLLIAGLIGLTALLAIEPASLLTPAAAIALGTVASRLPSRFAVGGYLALVVGPMLFLTLRGLVQWLVPDATGGSLLEAGGTQRTPLDPLLLVALVLGLLARSRRTRREIRAEQLARRLDQARNRERELLATEMHDVVGHSLTVMIALAGGAASGWRRDPERAELALRHLTEVGASALDDLQRSLAALRGETWEPAAPGGDLADRSEEPDSPERLLGAFRAAGLPAELEWR
ncbi:histidine kinase dimerization/phosphoacceptor domain-containing protein, partial [Leucobacter sp. M11]|uniref:histidine kinase dimerization/phosphoacceptor domain-containing protein n=1 Tax=Leucobacter sp. M11 TaxID=2993565 RepID=UPI002D810E73